MLKTARNHTVTKENGITKERKIGRPAFTYANNMQEAFSKYNLSSVAWTELSGNKIELKKTAEGLYSECLNDTSTDESIENDEEENEEFPLYCFN